MLVVRIELWPFGDEKEKREIGRTYIYNDGKGSQHRGNYKVRVSRKDKLEPEERRDIVEGKGFARIGSVTDYPRTSYNVWRLVLRALRSAFPEEK